jgi:predicted dehydrogenase
LRLLLPGAGGIGRAHVLRVRAGSAFELVGIADPSPAAAAYASALGVAWHSELESASTPSRPMR